MTLDYNLQNKTAVITGGSGIICSVIAKEMAKKGVRVAVLGRQAEKAKAIADEIRSEGGTAISYGANVLEKESLLEARDFVRKEFGDVDILINGAGGNDTKATTGEDLSFFDIKAENLKKVFDLNVTGAILTTQVFGQMFTETGNGCVVNISSMAAYHPLTKTIAYSAAKAAVNNFTQWMAVHFNQNYSKKIRVNAIAPGFLLTSQNRFLMQHEDGSLTERGQSVLAKTPMGRFGEPEELVGAVLWLCSDAAAFVNGAVIPVDGGFSAYWGV
ncbi:MAG: short-chain dehydrogenase/reductase [Bacillota bacterium]|jgi:NAD(P)-dependent dehydrogenase (short-subunit alcohol dehydrogenase family)|nr:short-chain dehydrogenase/reductase [Bacillota bacterium]